MDSTLHFNMGLLLEHEHILAKHNLELQRLIAHYKLFRKTVKNKDLRSIERNKIAIKKLEINTTTSIIKYHKETYLS
jgi:hypothetical protein